MAETKDIRPGGSPAEESADAIARRLERLESIVQQNTNLRKTKSLVSIVGLLLILAAVVIFVYRIVDFGRNYNTHALASELQKQAATLADSREVKDLINEVQNTCIPAIRTEIAKKFKADEPLFRNELLKSSDSVKDYVEKDVKGKIIGVLSDSLKKLETDLLKNNPKYSAEQVEKIIKEGQDHFIDLFASKLEKRLDDIDDDLVALNASVQRFKDDPDYMALDKKLISEYENRLIESVLELVIYQMNPQRGNLPASKVQAQGGVK